MEGGEWQDVGGGEWGGRRGEIKEMRKVSGKRYLD